MRTRKMGKSQEIRVQHVLREIRRHIREQGRAPRIDVDDPQLQHAWIKLTRELEHNAKTRKVAA